MSGGRVRVPKEILLSHNKAKNMAIKNFKKGKIYELVQEWKEYYDDQNDGSGNPCVGYHYAKPVHTGDYSICDCWIVNKHGEIHPGFNVSPIPVNRDSVIRLCETLSVVLQDRNTLYSDM